MSKIKYFIGLFLAVLSISIIGCGTSEATEAVPSSAEGELQQVEAHVGEEQTEVHSDPDIDHDAHHKADEDKAGVDHIADVDEQSETETLTEAETETQLEVEADASTAVEPEMDELVEAETPVDTQAEEIEVPVAETEAVEDETDAMVSGEPVDFTATTGLDTFSAYRMNFVTDFDGSRNGQSTAGSMSGLFEATKNPEAQHWQVNMAGNAFRELALLGGKMEMYDLGGTIFIQAPDGTWIGMPAMLVDSMLPTDMGSPEDSIELPVTAIRHADEEIVNDILTQRYTFGPEDLAGDSAKYENVEGTIWVAIDGNYVVKYQAEVAGQHNLSAGGIDLLDNGTITMAYEVTDVNSNFTIAPPEGAQAVNLTDLLFQ